MKHSVRDRLFIVLILLTLINLIPAVAMANPPQPDFGAIKTPPPPGGDGKINPVLVKPIDQPNLKDYQRNQARQAAMESGAKIPSDYLGLAGTDRVLVVLVEFAGTDVFTWTAPITPSDYTTGSQWDPYGKVDSTQAVLDGTGAAVLGDCSKIITQTKTFTYTGPLHNQIPRPASAADSDGGSSTWTTDFGPDWFKGFMFGNGVVINYNRTDGSPVFADFTGKSVKQYFQDFSSNQYNINGDVVGWVQVPHSTWYYGGDLCPGAISAGTSSAADGEIPGGGSPRTLVKDALNAVNAISNTIPGFNWSNYDLNGDGVIDRLWIVHAGYGEEEGSVLNRVLGVGGTPNYGESAVWSHSSSVSPNYQVAPGVKAGPYIMMPENGGIGVFAHEYAHNLGAKDLYAYGLGNTSTGFWALQSDDWTGYPIGFQPPAPDPWHLDNWGWLNPKVIVDPNQVYTVNLGQASNFPGTANSYRGAKIQLPNGAAPLSKQPWQGSYYWWGGKADLINSTMTTKNSIAIPSGATTATLSFDLAYDIETSWDYLWVQVSEDGGATWPIANTITNTNTACTTASGWIGGLYGFPDALCAAGLGGFTGFNHLTQATQTFDLSKWIGKSIKLRFWYMTDWGTTGAGPFIDNVGVQASTGSLLFDNAEVQATSDTLWTYTDPWQRSNGSMSFTQNYYLQWRNVGANGGYDSALGDPRWRYGPANTGLLTWYDNNFYNDNEIYNYLQDWPSFGPKGQMLVLDSHPDPVRNPASPYPNSIANWTSRSQMRDAPFSLNDTVSYQYPINTGLTYNPRPAVSFFDDGMTYYPGLEYTLRGASPCTTWIWSDKQWDTSAVVPGRGFYTTKTSINGTPPVLPPALTTGTAIRMLGFVNPAGVCQASWYTSASWYVPYADANNTGKPIDSNADFGWRVQIVSQAADGTGATVKIWNTHYQGALTPNTTVAKTGDIVTYNYRMPVNDGIATSLFACVTIDTSKASYVDGSATGGAIPLSDTCANVGSAMAQGKPLTQMKAKTAAATLSVGWFGYVDHGGAVNFTFGLKANVAGTLNENVTLYKNGALSQTLPAPPVKVSWQFIYWLPFISK